jgi:hypothetical protein
MSLHRHAAAHHRESGDDYAAQGLGGKTRGHRARAVRHVAARGAEEAEEAGEGGGAGGAGEGNAGEAERAMRLGELLSDPTTRALFVHPVVTKSGYTRERTSIHDAVPHRTMRSMVEGYVGMYRSRKGLEWKQVRKLCARYDAEKKRSAN